jgi:hypothetical protein
MAQVLIESGFKPVVPDGGYFILADIDELAKKLNLESDENET